MSDPGFVPEDDTIRHIVLRHIPRSDLKCWGCGKWWNPGHIIAVLMEHGVNVDRKLTQ